MLSGNVLHFSSVLALFSLGFVTFKHTLFPRHVYGKYKICNSICMAAMINKLVGANADANADANAYADANDWVTT